ARLTLQGGRDLRTRTGAGRVREEARPGRLPRRIPRAGPAGEDDLGQAVSEIGSFEREASASRISFLSRAWTEGVNCGRCMAPPEDLLMPPAPRLVSLDQFRGYTVLGMFLVNFVGGMSAVPDGLKHHHTYCSYADTIMPQFLLAVGFGMRLSF